MVCCDRLRGILPLYSSRRKDDVLVSSCAFILIQIIHHFDAGTLSVCDLAYDHVLLS